MSISVMKTIFHDEPPQVIKIERSRPGGRLFGGPVVDLFIGAAVAFGIVGAVGIAAYLWLALHGFVDIPSRYTALRRAHFLLMTYLFFAPIVIGFLLQAAPRFLRIPVSPVRRSFVIIPLLIIGVATTLLYPEGIIPRAVLAIPFLAVLFCMTQLLVQAATDTRFRFGPWIILSLVGFALSPFYPNESAEQFVVVMWISLAPIVLGIGQQFIRAFLSGRVLSKSRHLTVIGLYLAAAASLSSEALFSWPHGFQLGGFISILCLLLYGVSLSLWNPKGWLEKPLSAPPVLPVAFSLATAWGVVGGSVLIWGGTTYADAVMHLWALGWFLTLVITISCQVLNNVAGRFPLSQRVIFAGIILWQLVPFGRGLSRPLSLTSSMAWVTTAVTLVVFGTWAIAVLMTVAHIRHVKLSVNHPPIMKSREHSTI